MHLLSAQFDPAGYQSRFARHGRIRLEGALSADDAQTVHHALEQQTPWELHLVGQNGPEVINRHELNRLPESDIQNRLQEAAELAQTGLSYLHLGYTPTGDDALTPLSSLIRSAEFAAFCEALTGPVRSRTA
ncbi:MAG: hypothetical protein WDN06_20180 [Asticcacaulis sp.]